MLKLNRSDYTIDLDDTFPVYWKATDEQLRSALYDSDAWGDDTEQYFYLFTFKDIEDDFSGWTPLERSEYLQDDDTAEYTVYDWIRDCMMNSLSVVRSVTRSSPYPD